MGTEATEVMAETTETLNEILANLRKKYNRMNQLMEQTKELDKAARMNDGVSFEMSLDMRWKTMSAVDQLDHENRQLISSLPELIQLQVRKLLHPREEAVEPERELERDICNMQRQILSTVQKIITLDDDVRKRTGNSMKRSTNK